VSGVEQGLPIAYRVLGKGVPVVASDGEQVGTVHHVVAAPEEDIFHGLVIATGTLKRRFVPASEVSSIREGGVELSIDSVAVAGLPEPSGAAPTYSEDPANTSSWSHWARRLGGRGDWRRRS
jgi:uncharacterized protein YrrD